MERQNYVVKGMKMSNCKEFCEFIFGKFYIKTQKNKVEDVFEVIIRKRLSVKQEDGSFKEETIAEYIEVEHFKKHFKGKIKLMTYDPAD